MFPFPPEMYTGTEKSRVIVQLLKLSCLGEFMELLCNQDSVWLLFFGGLNITVLKPVPGTSNSIGYLISTHSKHGMVRLYRRCRVVLVSIYEGAVGNAIITLSIK